MQSCKNMKHIETPSCLKAFCRWPLRSIFRNCIEVCPQKGQTTDNIHYLSDPVVKVAQTGCVKELHCNWHLASTVHIQCLTWTLAFAVSGCLWYWWYIDSCPDNCRNVCVTCVSHSGSRPQLADEEYIIGPCQTMSNDVQFGLRRNSPVCSDFVILGGLFSWSQAAEIIRRQPVPSMKMA